MTPNITTYRWLADGTKAGVTDNEGNGFEYLGSFVYQRDVSGLNLESTSFGAGRFVASSTGEMTPFYHITDHLGSMRAVFTAEFKDVSLGRGTVRRLTTELIAQNDYYPFGLKHENPNLAQHTSNRYLYNGKEEQTTGNVDLLDYGARTYDPRILRWTQIDPLAEKYISTSPYVYALNNPILYIDPDGRMTGKYFDRYGNEIGDDGIDDGKAYLIRKNYDYASKLAMKYYGGNTLTKSSVDFLKSISDEIGGLIVTNRTEEGDNYTTSDFTTTDEDVSGYFLEPAGPSTTESGKDKRIPEGVYDVDSYSSTKFPNNFILSNDEVSKNRSILIHTGNTGKDTLGCLLPGTTKNTGSVSGSTGKMGELKTFINGAMENGPVKLIINNLIKK